MYLCTINLKRVGICGSHTGHHQGLLGRKNYSTGKLRLVTGFLEAITVFIFRI